MSSGLEEALSSSIVGLAGTKTGREWAVENAIASDRVRTLMTEIEEAERSLRSGEFPEVASGGVGNATLSATASTRFQLGLAGTGKVLAAENAIAVERVRELHSELEAERIAKELARKKLEVITAEHAEERAKLNRRIVQLESEVAQKSEQLTAYSSLVEDLDVVLLSNGNDIGGTSGLFSTQGVPDGAAAERVKRSLQMSREIADLKQRLADAEGRCERAEDDAQRTRLELEESRETLRTFNGERPNNFLARRLQMKGEELEACLRRERTWKAERDDFAQENQELREELGQAETSFSQIATLKATVQSLQEQIENAVRLSTTRRRSGASSSSAQPGDRAPRVVTSRGRGGSTVQSSTVRVQSHREGRTQTGRGKVISVTRR